MSDKKMWELASGQPMPTTEVVSVNRRDLIKQFLTLETAIMNALEDDLSEENEKMLQGAFKLLVAMRK